MDEEQLQLPLREAVRIGWQKTFQNLQTWMLLGLVTLALEILHQAVFRSPNVLLTLAIQLLQAAVALVSVRVALLVHDDKPVDLSKPTLLLGRYPNYLVTTLLLSLVVLGGLILLIVPGVMWGLRFCLAPLLVAEGTADPIEAFESSARLTRGVRGQLFGFALLLLGLNLLGAIALGVGLFITIPTSIVAFVHVFRKLQQHRGEIHADVPPHTGEPLSSHS